MLRILLVDDDASNLAMASNALAADGHTVITATDGAEALERYRADPTAVSVVVADVQMPGLDGIALVEAMLALRPSQKAILMSGLSGELTRAEQLRARGVGLLSKPYTIEGLRAAVRAAAA